jgi:chemotaxis protein MotB
MAAPELPPEIEEKEDWLITYADAITLLMAFMVMLLTFSEYDVPAFEEAAAAIQSNLTGRDTTSPIQLLRIDVQDVVYNMQADQVVKVETDDKGIVIELSSSAFYLPGSANIRDEATPVQEKLSQTLLAPRYQLYTIEIEGHTDDDPINTPQFPSNWELSTVRASRIVRFFVDQGLEAIRMKASGYAETKPKVPNTDLQGNPIPENKSVNRRVAIRIYPMALDERKAYEKEIRIRDEKKAAMKAAGAKQAPAGIPPGTPVMPAPETAPRAAPAGQ